jgi:hypothetical protein
MNDQQIIDALVARDDRVTRQFFFQSCRPLFLSIIRNVFTYEVDYEEFVNEFYLYLMENDSYRLRQFEGRSSLYQWMKVVAIRYFIAKRDSMIDMAPKNSLSDSVVQRERVDVERSMMAKMDVEYLLSRMPNRRYAYVIRRLVLQEADPMVVAQELETNVDNLYNIKKRAIAALTEVALKEVEKYEKGVIK